MRVMLDANILLDCLVLESSGEPRTGKVASDMVLHLCDTGKHQGLIAWHSLPIVAYYHGRQNHSQETSAMMDTLLEMLEVPSVTHQDAADWRRHGVDDFEDALQVASAIAGLADIFITRNILDFRRAPLPVMTPEEFLAQKSAGSSQSTA
jgi:predicted nucleic acid-binding protein